MPPGDATPPHRFIEHALPSLFSLDHLLALGRGPERGGAGKGGLGDA